jgi:hypothetical protein
LLHTCGAEATNKIDTMPQVNADVFTIWNAADSPTLRPVLKREGEAVICSALGTRYPRAA